ncbi:MAG: tetratricopeptide repeat protein [Phycisphaerales bacterium]|nr:tetratricopeptide repeat protein [Phycisphaerales bacterium]MCB9857029.1 tetratricopeptide repeat protein [Phycisphaerales bacterium]MCB9861844.1 tetratricopeptide repeat protein [Phycisphaerales bacterium]
MSAEPQAQLEPAAPGMFAPLKGRWQVPMFAVALLVFGAGVAHVVVSHETLTFEQKCEKVDALVSRRALTRAHAYVLYLLKDVQLPAVERAELHRRLIGITYQVEVPQRNHDKENCLSIILNFKTASNLGATPTGMDWYALGCAYDWSGRGRDAIGAYRQSLVVNVERPDRVRRRLVEMVTGPETPIGPQTVPDLDAILTDDDASPANYLWAMEKKTQWLLDGGHIDEAMAVVAAGHDHLAGTLEAPAVAYTEALCKKAQGDAEGAAETLQSLQHNWPVRDELWGRSNWLLGQIQLEDDRPQAAISLFEDVLSSFVEGDLRDACEMGRAESLIKLERFERALDVLGELGADARAGRSQYLSATRIRQIVTSVGEQMLETGHDAIAVRYLELASTLISDKAVEEHAVLLSKIARCYARLAGPPADAPTEEPIRAYLRRAAELHEQAAEIWESNTAFAVSELRLSADAYDAAGMTDAVIATLDRLVTAHPADLTRAEAMLRLGRAYQAVGRHVKAVETFDALIAAYPRWRESHAAINPLAESLLRLGGESAERGIAVLVEVVDDLGPDPVFTPEAAEYREALFQLAEYLAKAPTPETAEGRRDTQIRLAGAIGRLNDAIELYPNDPALPRLEFLRAESLRRTARMIQDDETASQEASARAEVRSRLAAALTDYQHVRDALARVDEPSLSELDQTYLRATYLYIGDCLFDLGRLDEAVEAYREAAWRYENDPIAVSAAMQVVHCFNRLGMGDESRAALGRMRWLVEKIPAESFEERGGMSPKSYWLALLDRIERTGV